MKKLFAALLLATLLFNVSNASLSSGQSNRNKNDYQVEQKHKGNIEEAMGW